MRKKNNNKNRRNKNEKGLKEGPQTGINKRKQGSKEAKRK